MGGGSSTPAPPPPPPKKLTDEPWTYQQNYGNLFSAQNATRLKQDLSDQLQRAFTGDYRANILVLGPIKAGKSSYLNSVASIVKGRLSDVSRAGDAEASYTTQYTKYSPRDMHFNMYDCMGIERNEGGFNLNDVLYLVNGNIPKNYPFNPANPITPDDPLYIAEPRSEDKIHCVVYVLDAEALYGEIPRALAAKIASLQDRLKSSNIPRLMVLTKVDRLCDKVRDDVTNTFRSVRVRDMVKKASELFKLPPGYIHPVKNHGQDSEIDHRVSVLVLLALKQACAFAEDYVEML